MDTERKFIYWLVVISIFLIYVSAITPCGWLE